MTLTLVSDLELDESNIILIVVVFGQVIVPEPVLDLQLLASRVLLRRVIEVVLAHYRYNLLEWAKNTVKLAQNIFF